MLGIEAVVVVQAVELASLEARVMRLAPRFDGLLICLWKGIDQSTWRELTATARTINLTWIAFPHRQTGHHRAFRQDCARPNDREILDDRELALHVSLADPIGAQQS